MKCPSGHFIYCYQCVLWCYFFSKIRLTRPESDLAFLKAETTAGLRIRHHSSVSHSALVVCTVTMMYSVHIRIMQDIARHISGSVCSKCGGPAPDWRCPGCGATATFFDPLHWRTCVVGKKMQAQCKECGQAEEKCSCTQQGSPSGHARPRML